MTEVSELLFDYALGQLDSAEAARVEAALQQSEALRAELGLVQAALGLLSTALPPMTPSPGVRARLLASLDAAKAPSRVEAVLGEVFDLGAQAVRDVLALIERAADWTQSGVPGFSFIHFAGGPKTAGLECGLIRLSAGFVFPRHRHLGDEVTLVVKGRYTDLSSKEVFGPGDVSRRANGTEHSFRVHPEEELVYAILMKPDAVEIFWPEP